MGKLDCRSRQQEIERQTFGRRGSTPLEAAPFWFPKAFWINDHDLPVKLVRELTPDHKGLKGRHRIILTGNDKRRLVVLDISRAKNMAEGLPVVIPKGDSHCVWPRLINLFKAV